MTTIQTMAEFTYKRPRSLREALGLLNKNKAQARVFAGGTDLVLQMKERLLMPLVVVDVKNLPDCNRLEWSKGGGLRLGAAVPLSKLLSSEVLPKEFGLLRQACSVIGSAQVKNRATVGGNICNAAPSADSAPALICLGAKAVLKSSGEMRKVSLDKFFIAPGKTVIKEGEILAEIQVPTPPANSAGCYLRHTTRAEMDIAVAGVASFLELTKEGKVKTVRIALSAVAPIPRRAYQAEAVLKGKMLTADIIGTAAETAAGEASPISDIRGSAEYRREMVKVLTRRTLRQCAADLGLTL
jgi:carbon-monoxide dehydrogenase medium subunit